MDLLNQLNNYLEGANLYSKNLALKKNICFVVGLPRSGSTLLQQVLISRYKIGYISNIVGKFWKSPLAGAILHNSLDSDNYISNFFSEFGNTKGPFEPCEFGWFWRDILDINKENDFIGEKIDWNKLNDTLQGMANVFGEPIILDTPFVCGNISKIVNKIDQVKVIHLRRDPICVCNSIFAARVKRFQDINKYYGAKPKSWSEIKKINDPIKQVVHQVYDLRKDIESDLKLLREEDIYTVEIDSLRKKPALVSDQISSFLNVQGLPRNTNYPNFLNRDKVPFFDERFKKHFMDEYKNIFKR